MKIIKTLFLLTTIVCLTNAQSLHDLPDYSIVDGIAKTKLYSFTGVELDEDKQPILHHGAATVAEIKYENGRFSEKKVYSGNRVEMEHVASYQNGNLVKYEIFNHKFGKRRLFKWYEIFYKGNEISHENVYYGEDQLMATANYVHSKDEQGNRVVECEMFKPRVTKSIGGYTFVYNTDDLLIKKIGYTGRDTGLVYCVTSTEGDSIIIAKAISSQRNKNQKWQKVESNSEYLNRNDKRGAPIYKLLKSSTFNLMKEKEVHLNVLSIAEHTYTDGTITGGLSGYQITGLTGSFYSERDNVILELKADGTCKISKYQEEEIEGIVSDEDWGHIINRQNSCTYFPEKRTIQFDGTIKDEIVLELKPGVLFLYRTDTKSVNDWSFVMLKAKE